MRVTTRIGKIEASASRFFVTKRLAFVRPARAPPRTGRSIVDDSRSGARVLRSPTEVSARRALVHVCPGKILTPVRAASGCSSPMQRRAASFLAAFPLLALAAPASAQSSDDELG